jgi:glutamate synthase domain-containing protein 2
MIGFLEPALAIFAYLFVFLVGAFLLTIAIMFIADIRQTSDAVRHNFPVIGRFRNLFSELGEFFRQYFFAMDREEMPFNRAERDWVDRAASGKSNTIAFGSTKSLTPPGTPIFVNTPFPMLDADAAVTQPMTIGAGARIPFDAPSFFNISGMSFGALSVPAVRALSYGAKMAGCWLNTGEGGLSSYHLEGGCDIVFQIGTAKYGVRNTDGSLNDEKLRAIADYNQVRMFEIKLSQGAKPGKGGILPGEKVDAEIAAIRGIEIGKASISPNRHPEIGDTGQLLDFIAHVRAVTGKPTGIKAVIGAADWLEELCEEIQRRGIQSAPDFFTLDGGDGGTGAAPMPLMDNVGLPLSESLPMLSDVLHKYNLRDRIKIIAAGKRITPADIAWAICAGADFVNSARGFLFSLGCIQSMKCNKNTCPTGVTTHDPRLQKGLNPEDKKVKVANYALDVIHEVEVIAHSCGVDEPRGLRRKHVRIVQANGRSVSFDELYPRPQVLPQYVDTAVSV